MARMRQAAVAVVAVLVVLTSCTSTTGSPAETSGSAATAVVTAPTPSTTDSPTPGRAETPVAETVQHVVVIVDENTPSTRILGNQDATYLNRLARANAVATNYSAITHPSLPNYLALTSGTTGGISSDCTPGGACLVSGRSLADDIEASGRTWKMYAEGMPTPCSASNVGSYAVKHNPFLYYPDVTSDSSSCRKHVVPFAALSADLRTTSSLPSFSFISPNLCHDMHDCSIAAGDAWLAGQIPKILSSPAFTTQRSLLVVTFDEGEGANNRVVCVFAGSAAGHGVRSTAPYDHYSLLKTVETLWGMSSLTTNDAHAQPMLDLLSR